MSEPSDETNPYPADQTSLTYDEAMAKLDALETGHSGEVTYEQANAAIDAMERDLRAGGQDLHDTSATFDDVAVPADPSPAGTDAAVNFDDLPADHDGPADESGVDAASNADFFAGPTGRTEDSPSGGPVDFDDLPVLNDDSLPTADAKDNALADDPAPAADDAATMPADHGSNVFDDLTVPGDDDGGHTTADPSSLPADDSSPAHPTGDDAAPGVTDGPAASLFDGLGLVSHDEQAPSNDTPGAPADEHSSASTPGDTAPASTDPAAASLDHAANTEAGLQADAPDTSHASEPVSAQSADTPATPPTDPAEYVTHLHEMNSDQVLDEVSRQDQPELRQAALDELKTRLHADTHGAAAPSSPDEPHDTPAEPIAPDPAAPPVSDTPTPITADEVSTLLDARADASSEDLQWQTSVVDLLKLLGKDSTPEAREHYAEQLGMPADDRAELSSSELNGWLHEQLLSTLAQNGGTLPSTFA